MDKLEYVKQAITDGKTRKQMAYELNCSVGSIGYYMDIINMTNLSPVKRWSEQEIRQMIADYGIDKTADILNMTSSGVIVYAKKLFRKDAEKHLNNYNQIISDYQKFIPVAEIAQRNNCTNLYVRAVIANARKELEGAI